MANVALGVTSPGSMNEVDVASIASDVFTTLGNHGFAAGDYVIFTGEGKKLTAAGITSANRFGYVIAANLTATTFQVSRTYGGSAPATINLATSAEADDIIDTGSAHGFVAGDCVQFVTLTGGAGLSTGTNYYVVSTSLAAQTFRVAASPGGTPIDFTTDITAGTVKAGYANRSSAKIAVKPSIFRRGTDLDVTINEALDDNETEIDLTAGHGARLPSAPFVLIIEGPRDATPTERYERVLVTTKSTDTLTVTRGYEGTTATAHSTGRKAWVRSLAPSANALATLDWREQTLRDEMASHLSGTDASADDSTTAAKQFVARANTLRTVTGTGTTLTTGSAHGMIVGDRFCFMTKAGGSNVRLGHTYYVTGIVGGTSSIQFAEEKHGSTYTTDITLATDITSGYIRVLTQSGALLFDYRTSLYPKLVGWMSSWGGGHEFGQHSFDCIPLTAALHFDPITLRGSQSVVHMLSATDSWEPAANKHIGQWLGFDKNTTGGTFTLTVDGETTAAITFSTTISTLRSRISSALSALSVGLTNVRTFNRSTFDGDGVLTQYGVYLTFGNSRKGVTAMTNAALTGSSVVMSLGGPLPIVKQTRRAQFSARLAKLGEQIAAAINDGQGVSAKVLIRFNYEFESKYMPWTAYPLNGGTDGQQLAYDAGNTLALWKSQWNTLVTAVRTTGGAGNDAAFWWCVQTSIDASKFKTAYPSPAPDFVGFDFYCKTADSPATMRTKMLNHLKGIRLACPGKTIVIGEFGHHTSGAVHDPGVDLAIADPEDSTTLFDSGYGLLLTGDSDADLAAASTTVVDRDPWFKALMEYLCAQTDVAGAMYYDLDMTARFGSKQKKSSWSLDGTPTLVDAYALRTRLPKNRRRL